MTFINLHFSKHNSVKYMYGFCFCFMFQYYNLEVCKKLLKYTKTRLTLRLSVLIFVLDNRFPIVPIHFQ